ncbi:unnamed protein product [Moneuplotes crassus]|uniref:Vacuolar protein sorting-associated protein 18 homolog n=1 Tax=Euplotes crassus TaxID=5936 RepID=A0AAD2D318_EUPCR|nr:unnamed protein product [Moneuplotes crassus]
MYRGREEYKYTADEEEGHKVGFQESDITKEIEQAFHISDYSVEGSIRYIKKLAVKNNRLWIYTNDDKLFTMKLGEIPDEINTSKIKNHTLLFIQPDDKGVHCVIGAKSEKGKHELFYLSELGSLSKIASFDSSEEISCCTVVSPEEDNPEGRIFEVLFGTNLSTIFYGRFIAEKKGSIKTDKSIGEVYEINPKRRIYDICTFKTEEERGIIAITDISLYQFWGAVSLPIPDIFAKSKKELSRVQNSIIHDTLKDQSGFQNSRDIRLRFQPSLSIHENLDETIHSVGWQSDSCFYCIEFKDNLRNSESAIVREMIKVYKYPEVQGSRYGSSTDYPLNCMVTKWHVIFLMETSINIYSKITKRIVSTNNIGNGAAMLGLCHDNLIQNVWMHSNRKIYYLEYDHENNNIWIDYFKIKKYKDADKLCQDPKYKPLIAGCVADQIFESGNYTRSAEYYAKSNKSFEEVTLKFLNNNLHQHLCTYLELFLKRIKILSTRNPHRDYKPQKILLCTWIVELKLNDINKMRIKADAEKDEKNVANQKLYLAETKNNFWEFVDNNFNHKKEIEQILLNHGQADDCFQTPKDHINKKEYRCAIELLTKIEDENERFKQMYKYCLVFLQKELEYTLETLKKEEFKNIDFSKLVSSFADVRTDDEEKVGIILSFLERYCIQRLKCTEKSVHNMAFYFMTKMKSLDHMLGYLQDLEKIKEGKHSIYLDLEYAFNQCHQSINDKRHGKSGEELLKKGQIIIYGILGLYEKAVDLALSQRDFELAKKYASKSFIDTKLKKNLWVKIAKEILNKQPALRREGSSQDNVQKCLELLDETKDILKVDDLLPFFPDDTKVEILKDKLCESLKLYNDRISNLKNELSEQSKNAEDLRDKNRKFKNKFISVHPSQTCELCFTPLLKQTFYAFHCGHGFHRECLVDELESYETKNYKLISKVDLLKAFSGEIRTTQSKAEYLEQEEGSFDPQDRAMSWFTGLTKRLRNSIAPGSNTMTERATLSAEDQDRVEDLYSQIDMRLKEECYLCGEMLIDTLDNDIAVEEDDEQRVGYMYYVQKQSWEIE